MMKCPTCGHPLARLADPCLPCTTLQAGRAGASVDGAAAAIVPTGLTLPAELRVPEAPAAPPRSAAPPLSPVATAPQRAARSAHAAPQPSSAANPTDGERLPATPEPGRTPRASVIGKAIAAGVALLVLVVCLGALRHRDPVPERPDDSTLPGTNVGVAASAVVPDPAGAIAAAARDTVPALASSTASSVSAATVTTARLKSRMPAIPHDTASSPVLTPPSPRPVTTAAASSRPPAEPAPPAAPEPTVTDPREACGQRGFIAAALCINERCAQPRYAGHAECGKLRKAAEDAELALQRGG